MSTIDAIKALVKALYTLCVQVVTYVAYVVLAILGLIGAVAALFVRAYNRARKEAAPATEKAKDTIAIRALQVQDGADKASTSVHGVLGDIRNAIDRTLPTKKEDGES